MYDTLCLKGQWDDKGWGLTEGATSRIYLVPANFQFVFFMKGCNLNNRLDCYWGIGGTVVRALAFHLLMLLEPSAPLM